MVCHCEEDDIVNQGYCCRRGDESYEDKRFGYCSRPDCVYCEATGWCHNTGEHEMCQKRGGFIGEEPFRPCACPCHGHFPEATEQEVQAAANACMNLLNQLRRDQHESIH